MKVSSTYILGVDISENGDIPAISVAKHVGTRMIYLETIIGKEALDLYGVITNSRIKIPVLMKNFGINKPFCSSCDYPLVGMGLINYCPNCGVNLDWDTWSLNKIKLEKENENE